MSIVNSITSAFVPIHREGYRFIAIFAGVTLLLFWLDVQLLAWLGVVATALVRLFFSRSRTGDAAAGRAGDFACRRPHQRH